jgi:protein TonB
VFLAISAYKEISYTPEKQIVPVTAFESSTLKLSPSLIPSTTPSAAVPVSTSEIKSETILLPPPPPPPPPQQSSEFKEEVSVVKEESTERSETIPFVIVEEMPMFPGGDIELLKFIGENTQYPVIAKENNIQGRVIIRFCVTAEGGVSQISVLKGVSPELDAEAMRVVQTLPAFNPGRQGGKPVPVWYMVPITFTLK